MSILPPAPTKGKAPTHALARFCELIGVDLADTRREIARSQRQRSRRWRRYAERQTAAPTVEDRLGCVQAHVRGLAHDLDTVHSAVHHLGRHVDTVEQDTAAAIREVLRRGE